jgi:hypothetical protein
VTTVSIVASNDNPAVKQQYTVSGRLTVGATGAPIAGKQVLFYVKPPGSAYGTIFEQWITTDANGAWSVTRSESAQGTYVLQINFYGDSNYVKSDEMVFLTIGNPTPTKLIVSATPSNPAVNQPFTISGYLTDQTGTKLSGKPILITFSYPDGTWEFVNETPVTDSNGYFSMTFSKSMTGLYRFEPAFLGDNTYGYSAPAVNVVIGNLVSTTTTLNKNINPAVGQSFVVYGYFKDANGVPIAGKEIDLGRSVNGQGNGGAYDHTITNANGYYSFTLTENDAGLHEYTAAFLGDQYYLSSYGYIRFTL